MTPVPGAKRCTVPWSGVLTSAIATPFYRCVGQKTVSVRFGLECGHFEMRSGISSAGVLATDAGSGAVVKAPKRLKCYGCWREMFEKSLFPKEETCREKSRSS